MNPFEEGLLRYLSKEQLQEIQSQKIGIRGAGGLGSNIAIILVRSGFRYLEIIYSDEVEASNLNRQQYFLDEIGKSKVETLRNLLLKINPDLNIKTKNIKWSQENAEKFFQGCNFIIEAFDDAQNKNLVHSILQNLKSPKSIKNKRF